jgi:hypothetical protein
LITVRGTEGRPTRRSLAPGARQLRAGFGGSLCISTVCQCRSNQRECQGVCIPTSECCDDTDCTGGKTCDGGVCGSCPRGPRLCPGGGRVAEEGCCNDGECAAGSRCRSGSCVIWQGTCSAGANRCTSFAAICTTATQSCAHVTARARRAARIGSWESPTPADAPAMPTAPLFSPTSRERSVPRTADHRIVPVGQASAPGPVRAEAGRDPPRPNPGAMSADALITTPRSLTRVHPRDRPHRSRARYDARERRGVAGLLRHRWQPGQRRFDFALWMLVVLERTG